RLENSIIVFCSDHGDMMGERRHMFSKYCLYDSSVRVPLIISGSVIPQAKQGTVDDRPAELVDIIPTIKNLVGIPQDPRMPGLDLLGDTKRLGGFCEFYGGAPNRQFGTAAYMWRKKDWKLILYLPGPLTDAVGKVDQTQGELYCLKTDPNEWHNLYDDPQHAAIREQMKTELFMHLAAAWAKGPVFYEKAGLGPLGADVGPEEL
ncbi:MAG: sulfatase-like hydrolase/transferase, partial [Firmicutes bacterium]|nr:sulfatase-like hydrolase/transferase [Bacillota bacterium]